MFRNEVDEQIVDCACLLLHVRLKPVPRAKGIGLQLHSGCQELESFFDCEWLCFWVVLSIDQYDASMEPINELEQFREYT